MNRPLLTVGNPKTIKGQKRGYLTHILHLAPAWLSGYNVCPMATKACTIACLNTAGRGGIFKKGFTTNAIQEARIRKTRQYFKHRPDFMSQLVKETEAGLRRAERKGLTAVFRLNGTSDLRWENVMVQRDGVNYPNVMKAFPDVQFYDYTKIPNRRRLPANYDLTFSLAESNRADAIAALASGLNVAAVFRKVLPASYLGCPVVNGDESDLRFLDERGVIVGLTAKGKAKKDTSGFVID